MRVRQTSLCIKRNYTTQVVALKHFFLNSLVSFDIIIRLTQMHSQSLNPCNNCQRGKGEGKIDDLIKNIFFFLFFFKL